MNAKLQLIQRKMERQTPERIPVAPASDDLAAAIERLVQERVAEALEQQPAKQPAHVQRLLDQQFNKPAPRTFDQLPPTPHTQSKAPTRMRVYRDGANQIAWAEMTLSSGRIVKLKAIRDGAGDLLGLDEIEESPTLPPLDIDYKPKAREYNPGEPR